VFVSNKNTLKNCNILSYLRTVEIQFSSFCSIEYLLVGRIIPIIRNALLVVPPFNVDVSRNCQAVIIALLKMFMLFITAELHGIYSVWLTSRLDSFYSCASKRISIRPAKCHKEHNTCLFYENSLLAYIIYRVKPKRSVPSYGTTPHLTPTKTWNINSLL
jgi:hypothetical protein